MSQYKPMMAGHPATQKQKAKEEDGLATTMLHIAALEGDVQRIGQLLRQGLFVDAPDQALKTPLHLATQCEAHSCLYNSTSRFPTSDLGVKQHVQCK